VKNPGPTPTRPAPTVVPPATSDLSDDSPGFGIDIDDHVAFDRTAVVSPDGTKLLFRTTDQSVVPGGFLGDVALILRDRTTGTNTVIWSQSAERDVIEGFNEAFLPDGSVAFVERGDWLPVPADEPFFFGDTEIYRWDVNTHEFSVLSLDVNGHPIRKVGPYGDYGPRDLRLSSDGRYLFFRTQMPLDPSLPSSQYTPPLALYRRDLTTGETVQVDVGNHPELGTDVNKSNSDVDQYQISADGRYVAFASYASGGLAEWGRCGGVDLIFLRDIDAGTTTLVSQDAATGYVRGGLSPHISADGRFVTYQSWAPSFVALPYFTTMVWDRVTGQNDWLMPGPDGTPSTASVDWLSPDGNKALVVTTDDIPGAPGTDPAEFAIYDRAANTLEKVSQLPDGSDLWTYGQTIWDAAMAPDGSRVYFSTTGQLLPTDTHSGLDLYSLAVN
jgi:Tol biopolymer transport system component